MATKTSVNKSAEAPSPKKIAIELSPAQYGALETFIEHQDNKVLQLQPNGEMRYVKNYLTPGDYLAQMLKPILMSITERYQSSETADMLAQIEELKAQIKQKAEQPITITPEEPVDVTPTPTPVDAVPATPDVTVGN